MMQELHRLYTNIPVPPNLKDDILTYCRTAGEKPKPFIVRHAKPLIALAACVAVLFVSLAATGHLFGGGNTNLPVGVPENSAPESDIAQESLQTTTQSIAHPTTQETTLENATTAKGNLTTNVHKHTATQDSTATTTVRPNGVGGDENACNKHVMFYHGIDGRLEVYVGPDKVKAYLEENGWLNTAHLTAQEREQITVVHFLKHFGITKQEFIVAMMWTDILDEKTEMYSGYYNDRYTYREIADALYSDDQALIDEVFAYEPPIETPTSTTVTDPSATVTRPQQ